MDWLKKQLNRMGVDFFEVKVMLIISLFITIFTPLFTSVKIENYDELRKVAFGYPIPFVTQNLSQYSPPLPYKMNISFDILDNGIPKLNFLNFVLSVIIIFVIIFLIRLIYLFIYRKIYGVKKEETD